MPTTFKYNSTTKAIEVDVFDSNDPITFDKIYRYFQANPIPEETWPQAYGGNPWELNENNTADWGLLNASGTVSSDTVEKKFNNYCTKFTVSSINSVSKTVSGITNNRTNTQIVFTVNNSTNLAVDDEILVEGCGRYDGIYRIIGISSTSIVVISQAKKYHLENLTGLSGTLRKLPMISFNHNNTFNGDYGGSFYTIYIGHCDKLRFSIKASRSGITLKGVILRCGGYGTSNNNTDQTRRGSSQYLNIPVTTSYQDIELDINNFDNFVYIQGSLGRSYYNRLARIYFIFDGLQVNDVIYLDGVRFAASKLTPYIDENNFINFNCCLNLNQRFNDSFFQVKLNIKTELLRSTSTVVTTIGTSDSIFGDNSLSTSIIRYGILAQEGATHLNLYGTFYNTFIDVSYFNGQILDGSNLYFNNVILKNAMPITGIFNNLIILGGTYRGAPNTHILNNVIFSNIYMRPITYLRSNTSETIMRNWIIRGEIDYLIRFDNNNTTTGGYKFINFDISQAGNNPFLYFQNIGSGPTFSIDFGFEYKCKIVNEFNQPLSNATVTIYDKDNNIIGYGVTDANGEINTIDVIYYRFFPTLHLLPAYAYFNSGVGFTSYMPIKIRFEKEGFLSFEKVLVNSYDRNNSIIRRGFYDVVVMQYNQPLVTGVVIKNCTTLANNDGEIEVNATGGVQPYQYSLNNINWQSSNKFSGLSAGVYTVYIKDANNRTSQLQGLRIGEYREDLRIESIQVNHCNNYSENNGWIKILGVSGGVESLQYSLDGINYQEDNVFYNLTPNTYSLYVKDSSNKIFKLEGIKIANTIKYVEQVMNVTIDDIEKIQASIIETDIINSEIKIEEIWL